VARSVAVPGGRSRAGAALASPPGWSTLWNMRRHIMSCPSMVRAPLVPSRQGRSPGEWTVSCGMYARRRCTMSLFARGVEQDMSCREYWVASVAAGPSIPFLGADGLWEITRCSARDQHGGRAQREDWARHRPEAVGLISRRTRRCQLHDLAGRRPVEYLSASSAWRDSAP